ncbi:MAG: hypothetical protein QXU67_04975 [Candidatus Bathyarchaeia archaeon]
MDVPISHIIGTIALIALTASVAAYFAITVYHTQADILRQQLAEVSSYVSMNLMEISTLINFASFSSNDSVMYKVINLPPDVSGYAYAIELINEESGGILVRAYLLSRQDIEAHVKLPLESEANIKIITKDDGKINLSIKGGRIESSGIVYSGWDGIVVWSWLGAGNPWTGIGILIGG